MPMTEQTPESRTESTIGAANAEVALPIREVDPRLAAVELTERVSEIRKLIAGLEEAKAVSQNVLNLEVSI